MLFAHRYNNWKPVDEKVPTREITLKKANSYTLAGSHSEGQKILNQVAHDCRESANDLYPGLAKY